MGLRNMKKRKRIFQQIREKKADITCLQETYITKNDVDQWKKEWGGEMIFCEGSKHSRGQVILLKKNFPFEYNIEKREDRIIQLNIKAEKEISIFNVYAPCGQVETKTFLTNLRSLIDNCEKDIKIVCGDFNAVMSNDKDIISGAKTCRLIGEGIQ